jgi:predicted GIY-YIG superfamily endonuclease
LPSIFNALVPLVSMVARPIIPSMPLLSNPLSLHGTLRQYRTEQAYIRAVPPSSVFSNALLRKIVQSKPCSLAALSRLHGIGQTRRDYYGKDIVRLVNLQLRRAHIAPPTAKLAARRGARKAQRKAVSGKPQKKITRKAKPTGKPCILAAEKKGLNATTGTERRVLSRFFPLPEISAEKGIEQKAVILPRAKPPKTSVYVLELEDGRVYVGSSKDVPRRLAQHKSGSGSAYTKVYKPTGVLLPRLGNVEGDGDAAERDETLRYMMQRGIPFVRGWKFTRVDMPLEEFDEAEANIRELFDLCRKCGYKGHFCTHCRATFDRYGSEIGK